MEKIGFYAMAYCLNLVEVDIPDSVRQIGSCALEGCESLKKSAFPVGGDPADR